ncbi:transcription factor MYB35-like [Phoenix dactylifera]|uniref:Transcription factor MYB35-like n=1 Tax=Phoenix dactylifera TaxID=42345 RepID=A0A8B7BWY5_PHODC|nr:transcription factor MYB35-like [Phoenix dactylifera]
MSKTTGTPSSKRSSFTHRPISDIIQIIGGFPATATATSTNSNTNQDYSPCSTRINNRDQDLKNTLLSKATPIIHPTFPERKPSTSNLLPQLHDASTITIVTYTSSSEASSSFTTTVLPILPELKWSDFLIEDVFLPDDEGESEPKLMEGSARVDQNSLVDEWWGAMDDNVQGSPYDGSSSFVVAILDRHQETLFQFPEFLDDTDYIL